MCEEYCRGRVAIIVDVSHFDCDCLLSAYLSVANAQLSLTSGTTTRVDAPPDFGVTASGFLATAYQGTGAYSSGGPYKNLRLIAKIEDPMFLLVAVKESSGIT